MRSSIVATTDMTDPARPVVISYARFVEFRERRQSLATEKPLRRSVAQHDSQERAVDLNTGGAVVDEPKLPELIHEKVDA
jgi:hypothetical protein